ncbi:MAG TPA: universal stress protein [Trebonia sp.]|nr:universal stress protein [Trebonia sp.]
MKKQGNPASPAAPREGSPLLAPRHPIIAGYDGSASARNALAYASGLARSAHRPLLLMHVAHVPSYAGPATAELTSLSNDTEKVEKWLRSELDQVAIHNGVDVYVHARQGSPARQLLAAAVEYSADALVVGASAGPWHYVAGSLGARLVKRARCPVIVVP